MTQLKTQVSMTKSKKTHFLFRFKFFSFQRKLTLYKLSAYWRNMSIVAICTTLYYECETLISEYEIVKFRRQCISIHQLYHLKYFYFLLSYNHISFVQAKNKVLTTSTHMSILHHVIEFRKGTTSEILQ